VARALNMSVNPTPCGVRPLRGPLPQVAGYLHVRFFMLSFCCQSCDNNTLCPRGAYAKGSFSWP